MAEKYNLPAFLLWASVIISATLLGVMVPEARTFPLIVALMFFTALYHSALLASSLANCRPNNITGRCQFYMDPLDGAHMGWTLGFVIFWLSVFVLRFAAVVKGIAEEDRDFVLAVFSGVELVLNVRIAYLTLVKWRSRASLRCRHQLHGHCDHDHDVEDLESGQAYDSMDEQDIIAVIEYLAVAADHMERTSLSYPRTHPQPPKYVVEPPPAQDTSGFDKEHSIQNDQHPDCQ